MAERREEGLGATRVTAAVLVGVLVGLAAGYPALREPAAGGISLSLGGSSLGAVGTVLLASALAVLLIPLGMFVVYQAFALADQ